MQLIIFSKALTDITVETGSGEEAIKVGGKICGEGQGD
jgi:hypothetical protein